MLWYKSWLDTRRWFLLGLMAPLGQVFALYMSYPMDAATTYPNGALGVSPAEMVLVRAGDFRSYVWVRWFSTSMLLAWPVFAAALAGTGFEASSGREYLLSLPVTRRRIAWTRLAVGGGGIVVLTIATSLVVCAMAPLVGQRFPVSDAIVHSIILSVGGFGLFGLTVFLRTMGSDLGAYLAGCDLGRHYVLRERSDALQPVPRDERRGLLLQPARSVARARLERGRRERARLRVGTDCRKA